MMWALLVVAGMLVIATIHAILTPQRPFTYISPWYISILSTISAMALALIVYDSFSSGQTGIGVVSLFSVFYIVPVWATLPHRYSDAPIWHHTLNALFWPFFLTFRLVYKSKEEKEWEKTVQELKDLQKDSIPPLVD